MLVTPHLHTRLSVLGPGWLLQLLPSHLHLSQLKERMGQKKSCPLLRRAMRGGHIPSAYVPVVKT